MEDESSKKKIAKKSSYSFLTKKGFRVDAKGDSPKEGYQTARSVSRHHEKIVKRMSKDNSYRKATEGDKLNGTYFKYDKEGLHSNEGKYYQHRPSSFKKGYSH